jgi:hypothetical protein
LSGEISTMHRVVLVLTVVLGILASAYLLRGINLAVSERNQLHVACCGLDLAAREVEYELYASGIYPNQSIASNPVAKVDLPNSVYPPYAFPMLAIVFAWGSMPAAGLVFGILTLGALLAIAAFGFRALRHLGWQAGSLGAVSGLAIAHNSSAVAFGQFSIICMGFVVGQMCCLRRGHKMAAGVFWAFAMFKPQIGAAFALLFLVDRSSRGLIFGLTILAVLSCLACWQTQVSPFAVLGYWFKYAELGFVTVGNSQGSSAGGVLALLGSDPRGAIAISLAVAMALGAGLWLRGRGDGYSVMTVVALCAIVGRIFIPHRAYDNIMLVPALLALVALAVERRSVSSAMMAAVFGATLWVPLTSLDRSAWLDATILGFWFSAAVFLITQSPATHGSHRLH